MAIFIASVECFEAIVFPEVTAARENSDNKRVLLFLTNLFEAKLLVNLFQILQLR